MNIKIEHETMIRVSLFTKIIVSHDGSLPLCKSSILKNIYTDNIQSMSLNEVCETILDIPFVSKVTLITWGEKITFTFNE